jgi:hypothetical protein
VEVFFDHSNFLVTLFEQPNFAKPQGGISHSKPIPKMSQSATLYRISQKTFFEVQSAPEISFDVALAKDNETFDGSFLALEFILSKSFAAVTKLFNPTNHLGKKDFENLSIEEQFENYESGLTVSVISPDTVSEMNELLTQVSESTIRYDSQELNDNDIYPQVWHDNNSHDQVYNKRHILEDLIKLKTILKKAEIENDYIFLFIG